MTGIYISVPFCRSKCTFCNFASGVFSRGLMQGYVERVIADLAAVRSAAEKAGAVLDERGDTIYLGGGTPTTLSGEQLKKLFAAVRQHFDIAANAEITVECAPGTLTNEILDTFAGCGVNRVSLGAQSFVDREAQSVGRLHTREVTLRDIAKLRAAGIENIILDLIAGLPHQTDESWRYTVEQAIEAGVPHVSVYMLEVDEDSRLGRELIAGGTRYHAHHVPDEGQTADFYLQACEWLNEAGVQQYEISNFAKRGWESRHNVKYWTRQPYAGFGVDAHSMLPAKSSRLDAVRFATADSLEAYTRGAEPSVTQVDAQSALEEQFFLGLRMNRGVDLTTMRGAKQYAEAISELCEAGLLEGIGPRIRLTNKGRLLSNEVFEKFLVGEEVSAS